MSLSLTIFCGKSHRNDNIIDKLQRIPILWQWCYWANPVAWSLDGLLTLQYGDQDGILDIGESIKAFLLCEVFRFRDGLLENRGYGGPWFHVHESAQLSV